MALKANKNGGKKNDSPEFLKETFEPGTYPARVVQILELGLQPQREHVKGEPKPPQNEIMLTYEFVDTFMKDLEGNEIEDKPRWLSETLPFYGLFADRAKSTQRYLALDPEQAYDGDFAQLINTPCNVTVVINKKGDKVYENIASIAAMRPRDAAKCPELVNPPKVFDLDSPDLEVFSKLPKWVQDKIKGNLNYEASTLQKLLQGEPEKKDVQKKADEVKKPAKAKEPVEQDAEDEDNPY